MKKEVYLKFENHEKLRGFMSLLMPLHSSNEINDCTLCADFSNEEIKVAVEGFGARVIEKPE